MKPKLAFWFRYGPAEHAELFPALPQIIESLAVHCDVHYFGMRSSKSVPPRIRNHATLHYLPFHVNRRSDRDKLIKTTLWFLCLPFIGIQCRWMGVNAVFIDETVPLTALLARIFFGKQLSITVADLFLDTYLGQNIITRGIGGVLKTIDFAIWRRIPLIFTRAQSARDYLSENGFQRERICAVYDPCDFSVYHPIDKQKARIQMGFNDNQVVLVYHGILHPNKGNDRILRALAPLKPYYPNLRYLIIGDGPQMAYLKELVRELNLEKIVIFTGYMNPKDVVVALNASNIGLITRIGLLADHFVVTSVLGHCMACGLPVLATRLRGITEIIQDSQNGYLFNPNDMEEFKEKLITLITNPEIRQSFGSKVIPLAKKLFSIDKATVGTVKPLLSLLSPRKEEH